MDFYLGLAQIVGVHTLLGLSAYCVLLTGQVSLAQAGFFAIGAYVAAMLTVLAGWHIVPAIAAASFVAGATACAVSFPALRVKGLMLVVATLAFGEAVRLFFFNFDYQVAKGEVKIGPAGGEGFRQIRILPGERLVDARGSDLHLAVCRARHGGPVVDGSLARRRRAARRG